MREKTIKKQANLKTRVEITSFYDKYGYTATMKQYVCICKSTLYNWLARRKNPKKTLAPDSRKPHKTPKSFVQLFYTPIVRYKLEHPKASCSQIQRHLINRKYFKISITTIWRALQKYKRELKSTSQNEANNKS